MPTRRSSEMTSSAPTPYSAIFSMASNTDCRGSIDRIRFSSLVFSSDPIVSRSFIESLIRLLAGSRIPYWIALVVTEQKCVLTLHEFSCEDHFGFLLLYLGSCDRDRVTLCESNPHFILKRLGTHIHDDLDLAAFNDEFDEVFPRRKVEQLHFFQSSIELGLSFEVVFRGGATALMQILAD